MTQVYYDYIIIGGGSAGCTLAARLTEDPAISVLLLEAGKAKGGLTDNWMINMPAAFERIWRSPKFAWLYEGEPEPTMHHRRIGQPRGKVLGGSSSINAMVFIRGHAMDFERWAAEGASGWNWRNVLPYFKRAESWEGGETKYRGGSGPIRVVKGKINNPLYEAFLAAGEEAGFPLTDDINSGKQEGFGALQMNVRDGVRSSTAEAYLRPNLGRKNLTVMAEATAQGLIIEGNKVAGVRFLRQGRLIEVRAQCETILSGGATNSPQLLMLSGIGDAHELRLHGIPCRANLPGVGANLQDHPLIYMKYSVNQPVSIIKYLRPDRMLMSGAQWMATHTGPAATNHVETGALLRSDSSQLYPDMEIQYMPVAADHDAGAINQHGFSICIGPSRIESRGWVKLRSCNPGDPPRILSNFLSTDFDLKQQLKALELGRYIASQPAYRALGARAMDKEIDDRDPVILEHFIRASTQGDFHLVGTCKMGSDRMSVVDSDLRVHGIEGLRVVDASVMPSIISANTNCTTIMIAERAADIILKKDMLCPANVPLPTEMALHK